MRCPSWSVSAPLLAATIALVAPNLAAAAPPPPTNGGLNATNKRFRFHIGTDVFSLIHTNPDGGDADDNTNQLGFGIGRRTLLDYPTGIGGGVTSLGFSGVLMNGHIGVGGLFAFAVDGIDVGDDGGTIIEGRFVPYFNYLFNPAGRITPFVGVHLGLGGAAFTDTVDDPFDPDNSIRATTSVIYPVVGPQGGIHLFIVPAVSVDFMVNFDYIAPHGRTRIENTPSENDDYDKIADIINVAFVNVGISAWF